MAANTACDLIDSFVDEVCQADLAGTGDRMYYAERKYMKDTDGNWLTPDAEGNLDPDKVISALTGHVYAFDFRPKTGQGQGTLDDGGDANNMTVTGRVDKGMDKFRKIDHLARFKDLIWFTAAPGGGFYFYYSPKMKATYASTFDSGQEYNSDHGVTFTVTVAPCEYIYQKCFFDKATTGTVKDPEGLLASKQSA